MIFGELFKNVFDLFYICRQNAGPGLRFETFSQPEPTSADLKTYLTWWLTWRGALWGLWLLIGWGFDFILRLRCHDITLHSLGRLLQRRVVSACFTNLTSPLTVSWSVLALSGSTTNLDGRLRFLFSLAFPNVVSLLEATANLSQLRLSLLKA